MGFQKAVKSTIKQSIKQLNKRKTVNKTGWNWQRVKLEAGLKLSSNRNPLLVTMLFVLVGVIYYACEEGGAGVWHILAVSLSIREPHTKADFSGLYQLTWPIFLEVIIFGFLLDSLLSRYNPVAVCKILAANHTDHTVVIGHENMGSRVVANLRENHKPFVVIDESKDNVDHLILDYEPVVVGSVTEMSTLKAANVQAAREIFLLLNNVMSAMICCYNIRSLNATCPIYVQMFEKRHFSEYFASPPLSAYSFSTSDWALEALQEWTGKGADVGDSVVYGSTHCGQRFVQYLAEHSRGRVCLVDSGICKKLVEQEHNARLMDRLSASPNGFLACSSVDIHRRRSCGRLTHPHDEPNIVGCSDATLGQAPTKAQWDTETDRIWHDDISNLRNIQAHFAGKFLLADCSCDRLAHLADLVDLSRVTHIFITWGVTEKFSDAVFLCSQLAKEYPQIKVYVRVFDEELSNIVEGFGATTFSTTSHAFNQLQARVPAHSHIYNPQVHRISSFMSAVLLNNNIPEPDAHCSNVPKSGAHKD